MRSEKLKLLIGGSSSKFFHLNEFVKALEKNKVDCKLVQDVEYYDGFPSRKIKNWFQTTTKFKKMITEYEPDIILIDRQRHFGLAAIESKIPLLVHLRGDFWKEIKMAKETTYKTPLKKIVINQWEKIGEKCFEGSNGILPICKYLENVVKEHYPDKKTGVMYSGINSSRWYPQEGLKLKHPCIGLLQGAVIWEKAKEMITLKNIIKTMPNVHFYWAGDGPYREIVLSELQKFDNFTWLGPLEYPSKVREFLTEIDVYALVSGIDMSPLTLQEAQLMEKPVIATDVGGVSEMMKDNHSGFLVEKGNQKDLNDKISLLINDNIKSRDMGKKGRSFIKENFSWEKIAQDFIKISKEIVF
jgi:glycosyltransferase involved in cell wall biosynthesis